MLMLLFESLWNQFTFFVMSHFMNEVALPLQYQTKTVFFFTLTNNIRKSDIIIREFLDGGKIEKQMP